MKRFLSELGRSEFDTVLDIGCGAGRFTIPLSKHSARTIGIDRDGEMIRLARARCRAETSIEWVNTEIERYAIPAASVDLVLSSMVLEHVRSGEAIFKIVSSSLCDHGNFLVRTMLPSNVADTTWYKFSPIAAQLELERTPTLELLKDIGASCGMMLMSFSSYCDAIYYSSGKSLSGKIADKSFEVLHRLAEPDLKDLIKASEEFEKSNSNSEYMSSSILIFKKIRRS